MRKRFFVVTILILLISSGCAMHHLQTPEVLPKGKIAGGLGVEGVNLEGALIPFPGFWVRTGVAPNFDIGIKPWLLGLQIDGKYGFNDYFAVGAGFGFAFPLVVLYSAEASLYGGVPIGDVLYPYGVVRARFVGGSTTEIEWLGDNASAIGSGASGVLGLRLRLGETFSLYGEGGVALFLGGISSGGSAGAGEPGLIFGFGATVGY
ncbi:hypothetical protein JXM67_01575 [candidate division WOR-3 bacterium]|nr:hypothetical protein [candidate division WOR-3 bacterium]